MNMEQLQHYVDDFLSQCDRQEKDEWYATTADIYSEALACFMEYLKTEVARDERRALYEQLKKEFE